VQAYQDSGNDGALRWFGDQPEKVRHLLSAFAFYTDTCPSGFHTFYSTSSGALAPEAVDGLVQIGLPQSAKVLNRANQFFGSPYPRNALERMRKIADSDLARFAAFDEQLHVAINEDTNDFLNLADHYARNHLNEFGY